MSTTELDLHSGPYRTTFTGIEKVRESTPAEWEGYGEVLRRVDEAKQWAIGDWLVDGKTHYGDKLYEKAAAVLGLDEQTLRQFRMLADNMPLLRRRNNLTWGHHREVASLKTIREREDGQLELSGETDYEKIEEFLTWAEKEKASVRDLREKIRKHKDDQRRYIDLANAPEKYAVIYADPPWQYTSGDQHTDESQDTVIGDHYPSMQLR